MTVKPSKLKIFFNASVILSGFNSPAGGSGKLLRWAKEEKINAVASEMVVEEIFRHLDKINYHKTTAAEFLYRHFQIIDAPAETLVKKYYSLVIDPGDAHILASVSQIKANYLVTLDKKHLLILQSKFKSVKIVSPKELIEKISTTKMLKSNS